MASVEIEIETTPEEGTTPFEGLSASTTPNLDGERIDCENVEDMTMRFVDPNRPSFVTILLRFYGNIIVDCFKTILE